MTKTTVSLKNEAILDAAYQDLSEALEALRNAARKLSKVAGAEGSEGLLGETLQRKAAGAIREAMEAQGIIGPLLD